MPIYATNSILPTRLTRHQTNGSKPKQCADRDIWQQVFYTAPIEEDMTSCSETFRTTTPEWALVFLSLLWMHTTSCLTEYMPHAEGVDVDAKAMKNWTRHSPNPMTTAEQTVLGTDADTVANEDVELTRDEEEETTQKVKSPRMIRTNQGAAMKRTSC